MLLYCGSINIYISKYKNLIFYFPVLFRQPSLHLSPCPPANLVHRILAAPTRLQYIFFSILSKYFGASYYSDFDLMTNFLKFLGIKAP